MGYHIFMARKVQLTTAKNNAYASMMNEWIQQTQLGNEEIRLMQDRNTTQIQYGNEYKAAKDEIYANYNTWLEGEKAKKEADPTYTSEEYTVNGKNLRDLIQEQTDAYTDKKNALDGEYSVNYQLISDQENAIEQAIQVPETHISEYTEEMSKVESQEATEIKTCIPNYNGAGGGQ